METETTSAFRKNGKRKPLKGEDTFLSVTGENRVRSTRYFPATEKRNQALAGNEMEIPFPMVSAVEFFHQFVPPTATAQQRRHTSTGKTYMPASVRRASALLLAVVEQYKPAAPLAGPLSLSLSWTWPGDEIQPKATRPDLDNLCKLTLDAMTKAGYWHDDAQVCRLDVAKFVGPLPGLSVCLLPFRMEDDR